MEIRIRVPLPISESESVKELLAMWLEKISKSEIIEIIDDGFGQQENLFPEAMQKIKEIQARNTKTRKNV